MFRVYQDMLYVTTTSQVSQENGPEAPLRHPKTNDPLRDKHQNDRAAWFIKPVQSHRWNILDTT